MSKIVRFGISIEDELLKEFDNFIKPKGYSNRSEAIRDIIRKNLAEKEWEGTGEVAGGIAFVYNHHIRELSEKLVDIQHQHHHIIISSQHVHMDHDKCLEVIVVKGKVGEVAKLTDKIRSTKGVYNCEIAKAVTG